LVKIVRVQHVHRVRIRFERRARRDAEVARLRVDRVELAVVVRLDPRDVVADRRYLPALEALRRDQHRQVRLAAALGNGDITLLPGGEVTPRISMCSAASRGRPIGGDPQRGISCRAVHCRHADP
jgi:hypothetical protein